MPIHKVTDLDHAILGLLARESLSGYRIRKVFQDTALGNYSSSPGSVYPALARLVMLGLVKKQAKPGSAHSIYGIAGKGRSQLRKWLFQKVSIQEVAKDSEVIMLRIAFMDVFDDREQKLGFLESYRKAVAGYIKELESFSPSAKAGMFASSRFAFEHGRESCRMTLKWVNKIISFYRKK